MKKGFFSQRNHLFNNFKQFFLRTKYHHADGIRKYTMNLGIFITANLMLFCTVYPEERTKRSCSSGCLRCSEINGCYKCRPRLYLYLSRTGISQKGFCIHSCPQGYFGVRHEEYSICNMDCMAGPWSSWTPCARNGQTCGYKYGITTRSRQVLDHPSPNGATCPSLVENRCCRMEMRHCADLLHNQSEFSKWKSLSKHDRILIRRLNKRRKRRRKNKTKRKKKKRKNKTRKQNKRKKGKKKGAKQRHKKKKKNRIRCTMHRRVKRRKEAWIKFCENGIVFNDLNSIPLLD